jgi:hypothetical protein
MNQRKRSRITVDPQATGHMSIRQSGMDIAARRGRPRSENPMVHTAVVLPQDLLARLRRDADASQQGVSAEIRRRLQLTYDREGAPSDPETADLIVAIKRLADNLENALVKKWHQHRYVLAAFKAGVELFLSRCQPEGDKDIPPDMQRSWLSNELIPRDVGEPHDPPDAVGRTHARFIMASESAEAAQRALIAQQLAGAAPEPNDELETD